MPTPPSAVAPYRPMASRRREPTPRLLQATALGPVMVDGVDVRCQQCRSVQKVMPDASGFVCCECAVEWHWAICAATGHFALVRGEQESWKCGECGGFTRSWWKTVDFWREIDRIVARRNAAEDEAIRRRQEARRRARRVALAGSIVGAIFLTVAGLAVNAAAKHDPKAAANVACKQFGRVEARDAGGTMGRGALLLQLRAVVEPADRADPAVRAAAREVYGAAAKGTASDSYRLAVTHMANACGMTS